MKIILTLLIVLQNLLGNQALSTPIRFDQVPEPLKPWVDWALWEHPEHDCAFDYRQFAKKHCSWPIDLVLDLKATGGHFSGHWRVDRESWLFLPGNADFWPQRVSINQAPWAVINKNGRPALKAQPGNYVIEGDFNWDYIPEQLRIAENTGLVKLLVNGAAIAMPAIKNGVLWLKDSERGGKNPEHVQDRMDMQVFRRILDEIPMQVITRIELDVAGSAREMKLSQVLLQGFIPMRLDSALPARLESDGQLLVQLRPGRWRIDLASRHPGLVDKLMLQDTADWPKEELWVFDARPNLRIVDVMDLNPIDASQTNLPESWRNLPAYRMHSGQGMTFKTQRRGNPDPEPNQLNLNRQFWLDFDGQGYTVTDRINGRMTSGWRLNALPETQPGKVSLDGQNQLITRTAKGEVGVEVRQGNVNVLADSRYTGNIKKLKVSGWDQDFHNVSAEMNLPPGWHLFAASGVDNVPDSWVARWTLLDLFMVLIASLTIVKLYPSGSGLNESQAPHQGERPAWRKFSFGWGLLAVVTFALTWHEADAPHWVWLHILAATALLRVLPQGRVYKMISGYQKMCALVMVLIAIPFIIGQVRIGLYPQLEKPWLDFDSPALNAQSTALPASTPVGAMLDNAAQVPRKLAKTMTSEMERKRYEPDSGMTVQYQRTDPHANVQTGPGVPQWQWRKIHLSWNGSVDSTQQVRFWYLSPKVNLGLNFLRVALVLILALRLFDQFKWRIKLPSGLSSCLLGAWWLPLLLMANNPIYAAFPEQSMLDELEKRLLEAPDCLPACADIPELQVQISPEQLLLKLQVDSSANVAIPLPAQQLQWLPEHILLDGAAVPGLMRSADGQLWMQVPQGRHQVVLQGPPPKLDKFTLSMPLKPHRVQVTQTGWEISGVHEHGLADQQLQFTRLAQVRQEAAQVLTPASLPAFFTVERTLHLDLDWRVTNRVMRVTPTDSAVLLAIPLLPGEAVLSPGVRVEKQQVLLNFDAGQRALSWDSVLAKAPQLHFVAPATTQWTEIWKIDVSPIWHMQSTGLAPVHHGQQAEWLPEWRPWPNEQLTLQLTRPEGVSGQTLTIESSDLRVQPGKRIAEASLQMQLTSSKGGQQVVLLPDAAELQSVRIDGALQPIRQQGSALSLPVRPGPQEWQIIWRKTQNLDVFFKTPIVNLGLPSVNSRIHVELGQDRWVLFAWGPRMGPAVLFWGLLLVLGILAFALANSRLTPLSSWQWFLLLIGISQIPLEYAILVVAWFMSLAWRAEHPELSRSSFNAVQVGLTGLTLAFGGCLFLAVEKGLLGTPEMQISGNHSSAFQLNWYQDRSAKELPVAHIISAPLLWYRCLMLFWSLWLAVSLIAWLKWGWQCFSNTGLWRSSPAKTAKPENTAQIEQTK